jgi:hypothetical protein
MAPRAPSLTERVPASSLQPGGLVLAGGLRLGGFQVRVLPPNCRERALKTDPGLASALQRAKSIRRYTHSTAVDLTHSTPHIMARPPLCGLSSFWARPRPVLSFRSGSQRPALARNRLSASATRA